MEPESQQPPSREFKNQSSSEPPVDEGEVRDVTIETVGDQGDGIAKVERGYVVIVPGAQPGDEPTVEIEQVQENVAFARIIDSDPRAL
jgi:predicted RNA-binding protein with TRAM domain